jgi:hypothetical protein
MVRRLTGVAVLVAGVAGVAVAATYPSTVPDPLPVPVIVQGADGGTQVLQVEGRGGGMVLTEVTNPLSATIALPDGGVQVLDVQGRGGGPLQAEVTGPGATPVNVTGSTVGLNSASLSALSAPVCTLGEPQVIAALSTTPTLTPAVPYATRTELRVVNLGSTREVWCLKDPGDGGVPTATAAYVLLPNGGEITLPVRASDTVRCRSDLATSRINIMEASCAQP